MIGRFAKIVVVAAALVSLLVSCRTREVAYISDAQRDTAQEILTKYTATIMPGDQLNIHVASQTPESVVPFNEGDREFKVKREYLRSLEDLNSWYQDDRNGGLWITTDITGYFVSKEGTIQFPEFGTINVVGLTRDSLCHYLENRLRDEGYVKDPMVTVDLLNFRVTVVGEVQSPQQIHVDGTRLTIFEALAICGDITPYGQRTNIVVVRQDSGEREVGEIDLTTEKMFESPYYYLHNNDIVYVEPNDLKKRISDRNTDVPKYVSIAVSVANIVYANMRTAIIINRINGVNNR